jgi:hypothetical protein
MSAVKLIDDINDKIISEYINDYPTFRHFLLILGEDNLELGWEWNDVFLKVGADISNALQVSIVFRFVLISHYRILSIIHRFHGIGMELVSAKT